MKKTITDFYKIGKFLNRNVLNSLDNSKANSNSNSKSKSKIDFQQNIKIQLELNLQIKTSNSTRESDSKSFYFFDFDDNVIYLTTPIVIFHNTTGEELLLSSSEWAQYQHKIGREDPFLNFHINYDNTYGTFRYFRDRYLSRSDKQKGKQQTFLTDITRAIKESEHSWKAPSWECFKHAVCNQRPMSIITARGHHASTIKDGIELLKSKHLIDKLPNYLSIFPVSNPAVRKQLGDHNLSMNVAELKRLAIRQSVESALSKYGYNPFHRFGMSDDDPQNIELITEEMTVLKKKYKELRFFVIQTFKHDYKKIEINLPKRKRKSTTSIEKQIIQPSLFNFKF